MDINITGNPGTGNTFQEIHIGTVQNYNPNATTVINNNYGDKQKPVSPSDKAMGDAEKEQCKAEIMDYVAHLKPYISKEWKNRYETLWRSILAIPEVDAVVYKPGKQKNTTFNRNLIANIIYITEPTLKSKACLKCLYFTIIIFDLCRYLEYFSYLYTINQTE